MREQDISKEELKALKENLDKIATTNGAAHYFPRLITLYERYKEFYDAWADMDNAIVSFEVHHGHVMRLRLAHVAILGCSYEDYFGQPRTV